MANNYATPTQIKALIQNARFGTTYDSILATLCTAASRAIDAHLRRHPGAFAVGSTETRYFDGSGGLDLFIGELAAAPTAVAVAETGAVDNAAGTGGSYTSWTANDYYCWPQNALVKGLPYTYLQINPDSNLRTKSTWYSFQRGVKITGYFGFSTTAGTPPEIELATQIQATRWFKRGQQVFEDVGAVQELNQLRYVQKIDPDVAQILQLNKFADPTGILG